MKTKAKDNVRLADGRVLTLGEAFDLGLVRPVMSTYYDPPRYFAREVNADVSWEIGRAFYESRTGVKITARKGGGR